jgi:hypothetical protein
MVSRTVQVEKKTVATISASTGFPKVVFLPSGGTRVITLQANQAAAISGVVGTSAVWETETAPITTVSETPYTLVLGRDFDTCAMVNSSTQSLVVRRKIPAPVLNPAATVTNGNPSLSWTNSFGLSTKIYRTAKYVTGVPTTSFTLIATVSGNPIPNTATTYLDTSMDLEDGTESVSFFVVNHNGQSATVVFTGPA